MNTHNQTLLTSRKPWQDWISKEGHLGGEHSRALHPQLSPRYRLDMFPFWEESIFAHSCIVSEMLRFPGLNWHQCPQSSSARAKLC